MNKASVQRHENSTLNKTEAANEIPVVHRLAIIYLMLPVVIWLVGWFEWWLGVPLAVLMAVGAVAGAKSLGKRSLNRRNLFRCPAFCAAANHSRRCCSLLLPG